LLKKGVLPLILLLLLLQVKSEAWVAGYPEAGLDEKPGASIPLDLTFYNEAGRRVTLKELIDRPTALVLLYYDCSHICPQLLGGLAESLGGLRLVPGRDYRVLTISFDETERPDDARSQKRNYIRAINRPFPEDAWQFLAGDQENIRRLSDAVGIRYKREDHGFIHPEVLIFVSARGMITKYMQVPRVNYGVVGPMIFPALSLKNAFLDASVGKVSVGGQVTPLYCFLHEPPNQERFYSILKISGTLTVLALFMFFVYLKGRKKSSE